MLLWLAGAFLPRGTWLCAEEAVVLGRMDDAMRLRDGDVWEMVVMDPDGYQPLGHV